MTARRPAMVVLGLGNPDRGDDGVGPAVARRVMALGLRGVLVRYPAEPVDLLDDWRDADLVVVVDAIRLEQRAGTVVVRDLQGAALPPWLGAGSTHSVGLAAAVDLARALDRLPKRLVLVGVVAASFHIGAPLSPFVHAALPVATGEVVRLATAAVGGGR